MIWLNLKKLERLLIQNKITESILPVFTGVPGAAQLNLHFSRNR